MWSMFPFMLKYHSICRILNQTEVLGRRDLFCFSQIIGTSRQLYWPLQTSVNKLAYTAASKRVSWKCYHLSKKCDFPKNVNNSSYVFFICIFSIVPAADNEDRSCAASLIWQVEKWSLNKLFYLDSCEVWEDLSFNFRHCQCLCVRNSP